jgi:hypothetical protein
VLNASIVAVLWQELASVEVYGRPKRLRLQRSVTGSRRCLLEGFYIHPHRRIRAQGELLVPKEQVARTGGSAAAGSEC